MNVPYPQHQYSAKCTCEACAFITVGELKFYFDGMVRCTACTPLEEALFKNIDRLTERISQVAAEERERCARIMDRAASEIRGERP